MHLGVFSPKCMERLCFHLKYWLFTNSNKWFFTLCDTFWQSAMELFSAKHVVTVFINSYFFFFFCIQLLGNHRLKVSLKLVPGPQLQNWRTVARCRIRKLVKETSLKIRVWGITTLACWFSLYILYKMYLLCVLQ